MNPSGVSWKHLALILGIVHFLLLAALGLARHWGYLTSINDLGVFDQAVWGILNGVPFLNTSNAFGLSINWLGFHFNPILLVFAPVYLFYPTAEWLIFSQAAAISITAWPLYVLAKQVISSDRTAFLWTIAYLFNPFVLNAAANDFHPVSLAAPLMAFGVLAIEKQDRRLFSLICLFLLLVQEHFGLAVVGFGFLWWLRNKSVGPAIFAVCSGGIYTWAVLEVIMPALSPTGGHVMMSKDLGQLSRYGWLGESAWEAIYNIIAHPFIVLKTVMVVMDGGVYLVFLLLPFLALPLAGIEFLIPGLADLLANLLSANSMPRRLSAYHSISLIPLLVAGGIYGYSRIISRPRFSTLKLCGGFVLASLMLGYLLAPLPIPFARNYWKPIDWPVMPEKAISEIRNLIPPDIPISAQANVAAHFTQRYRIYAFPQRVGEVDAIVLRLASPTERIASDNPNEIGTLQYHLLQHPEGYLAEVESLLETNAYGVSYWSPPWLAFSKGKKTTEQTARAVRLHLANLEREWRGERAVSGQDGKSLVFPTE